MDENVVEEVVENTEKKENIKEDTTKKKSNKSIILYLIFTVILCGVCSFASVKIELNSDEKKVVVYQGVNNETVVNSNSNDLTEVVSHISKTVVEVYTESVSYNSFYGEYVTEGAGSGVIITSDGYIITNNHVIEGASSIKVTLSTGETYEADLIGTDSVSDIAVIKIAVDNLPSAVFGDSDKLQVAQNCIAIGNPLGTLGGTVTTGIISALSRDITIDGQKMTLLQTDTSINPGNSGGGLFNYSGELIGIVNAKSSGNNIEGIGFAIPINYVKEIAKQLIENGYVQGRGQLGIVAVNIDSIQMAWNYGVNNYGIYVKEVTGENAKKAGLVEGDLIVAVNGIETLSLEQLRAQINQHSAGDEVKLTIIRNKEKIAINITLEQKK